MRPQRSLNIEAGATALPVNEQSGRRIDSAYPYELMQHRLPRRAVSSLSSSALDRPPLSASARPGCALLARLSCAVCAGGGDCG